MVRFMGEVWALGVSTKLEIMGVDETLEGHASSEKKAKDRYDM